MKIFELGRLDFRLACRVVFAYIAAIIFGRKRIQYEKDITYFNHLIKLDLYHLAEEGKYYKVRSNQFGHFILRKPFSSDYKVFQQVFVDREYQPLAELAKRYAHDEFINILDGGANIGLVTIFLNQQLKGETKVRALLVEPFQENVISANQNCRLQGINDYFIEEAGLFHKSCNLKIDQSFRDGMEWSVQVLESNEPGSLRAIQIIDLLKKYNIKVLDILKLDIEGAEKYLFSDEEYAAQFLKFTKILAIEIHEEYISQSSIVNILENNDFEVTREGELHIGVRRGLKKTA
jgi:FkbM family methyltransferase